MKNSLFIEPKTLKSKSVKSNVKILDATFFLPDSGLNAEEEYKKKHIPNSVFFDINKIVAPCGACRQVMAEYQNKQDLNIRVILNMNKEVIVMDKVDDLLPFMFVCGELKKY